MNLIKHSQGYVQFLDKYKFWMALAFFVSLFFTSNAYIIDDAYITLTCAKHLLTHGWPYFNVNQAVYTITNPLWCYVVALPSLLDVPLEWSMRLSSGLFLGAAYWQLFRYLKKTGIEPSWAFFGASVFISNPLVLGIGLSGMETPLFIFLILWSCNLWIEEKFYSAWVLAGLLLFVRIDGILLSAIFLAYHLKKQNLKLAVLPMLLAFFIGCVYLFYGYLVYEQPFPNSAIRKVSKSLFFSLSHFESAMAIFYRFLKALIGNATYTLLPLLHFVVLVPLYWFLKSRKKCFEFPLQSYSILLLFSMLLLSTGPINYTWYYIPPILGIYVWVSQGLEIKLKPLLPKAWILLLFWWPLSVFFTFKYNAHYRQIYHNMERENQYKAATLWCKQWLEATDRIAANEIGVIGFFLPSEVELLDLYGLSRIKEDRALSSSAYLHKYTPECIIYKNSFRIWKSLPDSFMQKYEWITFNNIRIGIEKKRFVKIEMHKLKPISDFY